MGPKNAFLGNFASLKGSWHTRSSLALIISRVNYLHVRSNPSSYWPFETVKYALVCINYAYRVFAWMIVVGRAYVKWLDFTLWSFLLYFFSKKTIIKLSNQNGILCQKFGYFCFEFDCFALNSTFFCFEFGYFFLEFGQKKTIKQAE